MSASRDLQNFLSNHKHTRSSGNDKPTHTRIGDKDRNIYGGSYSIPDSDMDEFYKLYYDKIFGSKMHEFLTEAQRTDEHAPIAVDFDFRYDSSVQSRKHNKETLLSIAMQYLEGLKEFFDYDREEMVPVYIM